MIKILKHMKAREWVLFGFGMIFVIAQVWLDLKIPDYMSDITVLVKSEEGDIGELLSMGGMMMLCAVGSLVALILAGYFSARLAATFSKRLRREVFEKVEQFSLEEIDHFSTASLITRSTNDVEQLQRFVSNGLRQMLQAPTTAVLALIKIYGQQWEWSVVTGGAVVIVVATIAFVISYAQPRFRKMQTLTDNLNRAMRENMTGIRVVRAYNAEEFQEKKFDEANERYMHNALEANRAQSVMHPVMQFANNGLTIAIYCIGAFLIAGTTGYGAQLEIFSEMLVFTTYAAKLLNSFMSLNMIFNMMPRASVSVDRINEILDTKLSIQDGEKTAGKEGRKGEIEFRNVSFHYPDSQGEVLSDISFTAHRGETVAFIGATGSGKSTLMNLVPRFYDATAGEILIDGVNVKEYTQEALREKIGMAPQRAVLFTGTVASNVTYGSREEENRTEEEVAKAVQIAQAEDFVLKSDKKYEAAVTRGGTNLSGGQRQRLSIARAISRKPEFYIFDDTFSALDYKTDRLLRAELKKQTAGVTTLIVAQRIGTIRDADRILVLDEGRIVGEGTHESLMKSCEIYREIAYTQLSEVELA